MIEETVLELERVARLPPEIQQKIFSFLSVDLQTLCVRGHIVITESRVVFLPSGTPIRVFAVGEGGCAVRLTFKSSILISKFLGVGGQGWRGRRRWLRSVGR